MTVSHLHQGGVSAPKSVNKGRQCLLFADCLSISPVPPFFWHLLVGEHWREDRGRDRRKQNHPSCPQSWKSVAHQREALLSGASNFLSTWTNLFHWQPYNNVELEPVTRIKLSSVTALFRRRYLLRPQVSDFAPDFDLKRPFTSQWFSGSRVTI